MGKKPKRGKGEGAIYQRKQDGLWVTSLDHGRDPKTGRRRRQTLYGKTRAEVLAKLKDAQRELDKGLSFEATKTTLEEYLQRWLQDSVKPSVRQSTYEGYEYLSRVHIIPAIGQIKLSKLTPLDLQRLYNEKYASGLSARTVRYIHATLHRALAQAVKWRILGRNVADAVDLPAMARHKVNPLTPEQVSLLLDAAKGDRWEALYVLAVTTGMRQGELLGLCWEDVDLDRGTIQVRRALVTTHAGRSLGEPKTESARRLITLAPIAVEALRTHRVNQLEQRLLVGERWEDNDLVFPSSIGTPMHPGNLVKTSFLPLLERAGLPRVRFHDLRHTAATILLSEGVHPKVVQERLGHSQISLTLDTYSHVLPSLQEEAASKLDRLFPVRNANT